MFLGGPFTDDDYRARRRAALVIAVNCATASSTCFCTSMGTGPEVRSGYDIVLTELDDQARVRALVYSAITESAMSAPMAGEPAGDAATSSAIR